MPPSLPRGEIVQQIFQNSTIVEISNEANVNLNLQKNTKLQMYQPLQIKVSLNIPQGLNP